MKPYKISIIKSISILSGFITDQGASDTLFYFIYLTFHYFYNVMQHRNLDLKF